MTEQTALPPDRQPRDEVEEASIQSFPASDPPASQPLHTGGPVRSKPGQSERGPAPTRDDRA